MSFDVATYATTAERLQWDDLNLQQFRTQRLSQGALQRVRDMSDVETQTGCYLRDLLVTTSTALDQVLEVHDIPTGPEHTRALRKRPGWQNRPLRGQIGLELDFEVVDVWTDHR